VKFYNLLKNNDYEMTSLTSFIELFTLFYGSKQNQSGCVCVCVCVCVCECVCVCRIGV